MRADLRPYCPCGQLTIKRRRYCEACRANWKCRRCKKRITPPAGCRAWYCEECAAESKRLSNLRHMWRVRSEQKMRWGFDERIVDHGMAGMSDYSVQSALIER